jgi:type II secretory pathway pseudopilin PulG
MKTISILIPMHLAGQAKRKLNGSDGYAMAALLIAMSIMAVMFTVAMPVWKQTAQREKEEELVFRGKQYIHAIGLFQRKFANAYPPNIDVLVDQKFLRKKFKDPITNDDFVPIPVGQGAPGSQTPAGQRGAPGAIGAGQTQTQPQTPPPNQSGRTGGPGSSTPPGQTAGGVSGVTSKSKAQSIRLYNGRGHYNEWAFVYIQQQQAAGAGAAGTATPGRGTGPGTGRGQRGQPGQPPGPFPGGSQPGQRGPGPFGPGRSTGPFGGGGVTPIQPPTPRGRF